MSESETAVMGAANLYMQRRLQITRRIDELRAFIGDAGHRLLALRKQWLELASIHSLQIDPIEPDSIPFADYSQTKDAKFYRKAEWAAAILGTVIAAFLSAFSLAADPIYVFIISIGFAALLSFILVGVIRKLTDANPRNPGAARTIKVLVGVFAIMTVGSLIWFGSLRFSDDPNLVNMVPMSIVGFELGVFGLTAMFHALNFIYGWSDDITRQYLALKQKKAAAELEVAENQSALAQFQLEHKKED
jgi:hypothetical protein